MSSTIHALQAIKSDLMGVAGIKTVSIGLESGLNANSYPAIRIVPVINKPESIMGRNRLNVDIFVGFATKPEALEETYETLYNWEAEIINRLETAVSGAYSGMWQKTQNDEDALPAAKLICVSFEVVY